MLGDASQRRDVFASICTFVEELVCLLGRPQATAPRRNRHKLAPRNLGHVNAPEQRRSVEPVVGVDVVSYARRR